MKSKSSSRWQGLALVAALGWIMAAHAATRQVQIVDYAFNPQVLTVNVGDTVLWINSSGGTAHTTTSDDGLWNSGLFTAPTTFSRIFNTPGNFGYYCQPHRSMGMIGIVRVLATDQPRITRQPVGRAAVVGTDATFAVSASGASSPAFQWRFKGVDLTDSAHSQGATSNQLRLLNVTSNDAGAYTVIVSNSFGAVTSTPALLTIRPDSRRPIAFVTSPRPNARVSNDALEVRGRASDDGRVTGVSYQLNSGAWLPASGTSNWLFTAELTAGTNQFRMFAEDAAEHRSVTNTFLVIFVVTNSLVAAVSPADTGFLAPNLNGRLLEIGRGYSMTAMPARGHLLSNWVGRFEGQNTFSVQGSEPRLPFLMRSNLVLQANIVTNPFIALQGSYNGIFTGIAFVDAATAGYCHVDVNSSGSYSGYLRMTNQRYPFTGKFFLEGFSSASIRRKGSNDLSIELRLPVGHPEDDRLTGFIVSFNPGWQAELTTYRAPVYPAGQSSPFAGSYTWVGMGKDPHCSPDFPGGFTYGTVNVGRSGLSVWNFTLGDGAAATWTAPVSRDGFCPVFAAPYGRLGVYGGLMNFNPAFANDWRSNLTALAGANTTASNDLSQAALAFGGEAYWARMPGSNRFYPGGFTEENLIFGSKYVKQTRTMDPINYDMGFKCANLTNHYYGDFIWGSNNRVSDYLPRDWRFQLTLDAGSGRFTGSARLGDPSLRGLPLNYRGVVLQGFDSWAGQFPGTNKTGKYFAVPTRWHLLF